MGLFGDILTDPAEREKLVLRKALEQRREAWGPRPGYVYEGAGDLLLRHGRFWQGRELPEAYQHLFQVDGGEGDCFRNAWHAAKQSGLRYCEGVYTTGQGHYTPHAWALDPDGELLELTFPTDPEELLAAKPARARGMPHCLTAEHFGYWGVEIHVDYVEALGETEGAYGGAFDRPIHDELFLGPNFADPRDHWQILTYPYDPQRREP